MTITIKITGEDIPSIMGQMLAFVHGQQAATAAPDIAVPEEPKRPRGRPPKTFASTEDGVTTLIEEQPFEAPPVEPAEEQPEEDVAQDSNALANEKLKAEVIDSLQSLFVAGKVKVLRHVLDKYGNGAKSFPEIDASRFHAIKEALDRGEAA